MIRPAWKPTLEPLEDRTLLAVRFLPGPLAAGTVSPAQTFGGVDPNGYFTSQNTLTEPQVKIDVSDPTRIFVGSQWAWTVSTNSGGTFQPVTYPDWITPSSGTSYNSDGDVGAAYDGQGNLYVTTILNQAAPTSSDEVGIGVFQLDPATAADLAGYPVDVAAGTSGAASDDKPFVAVDPRNGNLYAAWAQYYPGLNAFKILVAYSTDQGQRWSTPRVVSGDPGKEGFDWPPTVAVGRDGTVYVAYHSQPGIGPAPTLEDPNPGGRGQVIVVAYSNDLSKELHRGLAFRPGDADVTYNVQSQSTTPKSGFREVPGAAFWTQGSDQTWLLPDPSRPGVVYAVTADGEDLKVKGGSYGNVVLATSHDSGASWSRPVTIMRNRAPNFSFFPTAAIDRNGDIVVAWYQNHRAKNSQGDYLLDVFATYSTDGGKTWARPFRVNGAPFDPDPNAWVRYWNTSESSTGGPPLTTRVGEYFGLDVFGNTAYLAYIGNTFDGGGNPDGQQVYYATFGIPGGLEVRGDKAGPGQSNTITVSLQPGNPAFFVAQVNGITQYAGLLSTLTYLRVKGGAGATNTLVIDCTNGNPIPAGGLTVANISSVQTIGSTGADVSVRLGAPARVTQGQDLTYHVAIKNNGPAASLRTALRDVLPAGLVFVSAHFAQGSVHFANGTVTAELGSLTPGVLVTGDIVVAAVQAGRARNTVVVTSEQTPRSGVRKTASTRVNPPPALVRPVTADIVPGLPGWSGLDAGLAAEVDRLRPLLDWLPG
jgi:uncharacterized repeat protein (TIGR01451 family)